MANLFFRDVTAQSGISYVGESWGAYWADVNGDSWLDVWTPNHLFGGRLYVSQRDGTFREATKDFFGRFPRGDFHGHLGRFG